MNRWNDPAESAGLTGWFTRRLSFLKRASYVITNMAARRPGSLPSLDSKNLKPWQARIKKLAGNPPAAGHSEQPQFAPPDSA
jgi:hypothetical protein